MMNFRHARNYILPASVIVLLLGALVVWGYRQVPGPATAALDDAPFGAPTLPAVHT